MDGGWGIADFQSPFDPSGGNSLGWAIVACLGPHRILAALARMWAVGWPAFGPEFFDLSSTLAKVVKRQDPLFMRVCGCE
jgi:hypothetical protein